MSDQFKLEITNRGVRITILNNVNENFATEYRELLTGGSKNNDNTTTIDLDFDDMTPAMRTVFGYDFIGPIPSKKESPTTTNTDSKKKYKSQSKASDEFVGKYSVYNYNKRVKQRVLKFRTLAYINFRVPNVQFVTLTFDPKKFEYADNLDECHHAFQKFVKRFHKKYSDFMYIATFSRQKSNSWHYHMLCNLNINVKNKPIQDIWQYGMTHSTAITTYNEFDTRVSYCIDNMYKVAWSDLRGEKGYLACHGLQNSVVLRSWNEAEHDKAYEYLAKILNSTDKPVDLVSRLLENTGNPDNAPRVSYKISHKVFPEFFTDIKIAKPKKGTV